MAKDSDTSKYMAKEKQSEPESLVSSTEPKIKAEVFADTATLNKYHKAIVMLEQHVVRTMSEWKDWLAAQLSTPHK